MEVRVWSNRRSEIEKRVYEVLAENGCVDVSGGRIKGFDSLEKVKIVLELEDKFGINIPDGDIEDVFGEEFFKDNYDVPIDRFVDYINRRQNVVVK
ncbi:MAG: hypothetical protein V1889_02825 [archaeon]